MQALRLILLVAAVAYLGVLAFMYLQQRSLQYFPSRAGTPPEALGLSGVTEQRVKTPDGETIVTWHAKPQAGHAHHTVLPRQWRGNLRPS